MPPIAAPVLTPSPLTGAPGVLGPDARRAEGAAVRALADGRTDDLMGAIEALRASDPLVADIVAADAGSRLALVSLAELHALVRRAADEAPDRPLLRWWVVAVLGERAFLDTDLGAIPLALATLTEVPGDPYGPELLLFVRGRLRRIASAAYLIIPSPEAVADHRRMRDLAVEDFLRADFTVQVAITRGLSSALHALATWEDLAEDLGRVRDARALLAHVEGSAWAPLLDLLYLFVALACGEPEAIDAGLLTADRHRDVHRVVAAVADFGRAVGAVMRTGGSDGAVADLGGALDALRDTHPHLLPLTRVRAANVLADCGRADDARAIGLAALDWPPINPAMVVVGDLLRIRLDVLDGTAPPIGEVLDQLDRLEALGNVRQAAGIALRIAGDQARRGTPEDRDVLLSWGTARLPAPHRWTPWERRWAAAAVDGRPAGEPGPTDPAPVPASGIDLRVLAPVLEIEVGGRAVALRTMPAKLLLALVVAHPAPLHVEQAVDTLWPDADLDIGRRRLNTVVHRLRTSLGLPDGALRRTGDVLVLSVPDLRCDLFAARRVLRDGEAPGERWPACTGNLCHVQFPYDDAFVDARRSFATDAVRTIDEIVRTADEAAARRWRQVRAVLDPGQFGATA